MKKFFVFFVMLTISLVVISQEVSDYIDGSKLQDKNDRVLLGLYTDMWQKAPDSIGIRAVNQGFSLHSMNDYPFTKNLSFAIGFGVSSHNLYSNSWLLPERDSLYNLTDKSAFYKIPDSISFKKNKLSLTYIEVPIEFRFRGNENEGIKIAVGFKAGLLINNHTKYKGDEYIFGDKKTIKEKFFDNENILNYRYGATARIGYKWINLNVFYSLTNLFKDDKGTEMYPLSVGFTITPF